MFLAGVGPWILLQIVALEHPPTAPWNVVKDRMTISPMRWNLVHPILLISQHKSALFRAPYHQFLELFFFSRIPIVQFEVESFYFCHNFCPKFLLLSPRQFACVERLMCLNNVLFVLFLTSELNFAYFARPAGRPLIVFSGHLLLKDLRQLKLLQS